MLRGRVRPAQVSDLAVDVNLSDHRLVWTHGKLVCVNIEHTRGELVPTRKREAQKARYAVFWCDPLEEMLVRGGRTIAIVVDVQGL